MSFSSQAFVRGYLVVGVVSVAVFLGCSDQTSQYQRSVDGEQGAAFEGGDSEGVAFKAGTQAAALFDLPDGLDTGPDTGEPQAADEVNDGSGDSVEASTPEQVREPDSRRHLMIQPLKPKYQKCRRGMVSVTLFREINGSMEKVEQLSARRLCLKMALAIANLEEGQTYAVAMELAGIYGRVRYSGVSEAFSITAGTVTRIDLVMKRVVTTAESIDAIVRVKFEN